MVDPHCTHRREKRGDRHQARRYGLASRQWEVQGTSNNITFLLLVPRDFVGYNVGMKCLRWEMFVEVDRPRRIETRPKMGILQDDPQPCRME